jgi:hypothetical protein
MTRIARRAALLTVPAVLLVAWPVFYAVGMQEAGFLSLVGAIIAGGLWAAFSMVRSLMC